MDLSPYLIKSLQKDFNFREALEIVKQNANSGKIWLVGGSVFRPLVEEIYHFKKKEDYDFDFIVETIKKSEDLQIPRGWNLKKTQHGSPRLLKKGKQIDFWPLDEAILHSDKLRLSKMSSSEKLESYFKRVPLNIQAIAYDTIEKKVLGETGIKAIADKKIEINNLNECRNFCKSRKISIRNFIRSKIGLPGFHAVYPKKFEDNQQVNETIKFYDVSKEDYEKNRTQEYNSFIKDNLSVEVENFLNLLKGKKIMDLGSGPGRDSLYFKLKGFDPICVDFSNEMIILCKQKGLKAYQKNMEDLDFEDNSFDGIWAYASLVHLPKFSIHNVLARINELLKKEGLFFLGMLEGKGEVIYENKKKANGKRFFSLYGEEELKNILSDYFDIIESTKFKVGDKQTYLNYLCKKRS